jgi:aldehyde:ferredoxin oxidoreductase
VGKALIKGYAGTVLHVDLSTGALSFENPAESFYRLYIGGACMGAYYCMKEMPAGVDAFAPENVLVFSISPVVGAPISGNARHCVTSKSPLTGGLATSEAGGFWGPELRFAGFDAVVVTGRAAAPVYLWVHDGECALRDASHLHGKVTGEVQDAIRAELGDERIRVAQIGPAGEKLVRFAAIVNELKHFNGRAGLGAVMGSKNLRAIAVRGTMKPEYADAGKIHDLARSAAPKMKEEGFFKIFKRLGTLMNMEWNTGIGGLPTRNWTRGTFAEAEKLSSESYAQSMMDAPGTCWACVQSCKRDIREGAGKPWKVEARYGGPEYETVGMLGTNCCVADWSAIAKANEIASSYGMDTISLGGVIGFVMECFEKGIVTREDLDGVAADFGSSEALVRLAEMTARREGFGDAMAEGTGRLSRKLGSRAERIAVVSKDKEFPAHMPTSKAIMSLIYAVNPFGPDHVSAEHDGSVAATPGEVLQGVGIHETIPNVWEMNDDKVRVVVKSQRFISAIDSFSVCQFCFNTWTLYTLEDLVALVNAATGWRFTIHELMILGERRINLMRAFNAREGFSIKDDTLPPRLFDDPLLDDGPRKGATVDRAVFTAAREEYYRLSGWDPQTGNPTEAKLRELGLGWVSGKPTADAAQNRPMPPGQSL